MDMTPENIIKIKNKIEIIDNRMKKLENDNATFAKEKLILENKIVELNDTHKKLYDENQKNINLCVTDKKILEENIHKANEEIQILKDGGNRNKEIDEMKHKHTLLENEIERLKIIEEKYKECEISLQKCTNTNIKPSNIERQQSVSNELEIVIKQ